MSLKISKLKHAVEAEGVGLHSGVVSRVVFHPPDRPGIFFQAGGVLIPADPQNVESKERGVSLGKDGAAVKTVEHLLAALFWLGVRDARIEVFGEEIPVLDGSALLWMDLLKPHLAPTQEDFPEFTVTRPLEMKIGDSWCTVVPAENFTVSYTIDYPGTPVGRQTWQGRLTAEVFERDLAAARTFGFVEEVESLRNKGLAQGGNLENCVVMTHNALLTSLRFSDEPVRHKVLDLMGDLALTGSVPKAGLEVYKGSHRLHIAVAKIFKETKAG